MIFNMTSENNELAFEVVGGTSRPSNPKENTIWVNTSVGITKWYMSPMRAFSESGIACVGDMHKTSERAQNGDIWIKLNSGSFHYFDASETNNDLYLYPIKCVQCVNNNWTEKYAYIYKNGKWRNIGEAILYSNANSSSDEEYNYLTTVKHWSVHSVPYSGSSGVVTSFTNNTSGLKLSFNPDTWGSDASIGTLLLFDSIIDLTDYNTLTFKGSFTKYSSSSSAIYACWDWPEYVYGETYQQGIAASTKITSTNSSDIVIDVSALRGEHYIGVGVRASDVLLTSVVLS